MEAYLLALIVVALLGYLLWIGALAWRLRRQKLEGEETRKQEKLPGDHRSEFHKKKFWL